MGLSKDSKAVAGNAIRTLSVIGWAKTTKGRSVNIQFTRQEPPALEPTRTWRGEVLLNGPPVRPPLELPVPGANELVILVDKVIGDGHCGTVLAINAMRMTNSKDPSQRLLYPQPPYLPELVIKVAASDRAEALRNEAAIYDEMELLQGVSIPRCYGLFTAELEPEVVIPSLASDSSRTHVESVSILLLERVGKMLPLGDKLPEEGDLWDVFRDLARLGVEQTDIRYSNILQAPSSSSSLPGIVCPFHYTVHHYRIIDFDSARKTDFTLKRHYYNTLEHLGPILDNLKNQVVIESPEVRAKTNRASAL